MNVFARPLRLVSCFGVAWLRCAAGLALAASAAPAPATTIERVVSPGGIEAWLVHEPAVPLIAVDFRFRRRRRPGSCRQGGHRQSRRLAARRGRGRSRFQGVPRPARTQSHRAEFQRRARRHPRLAAHADAKIATRPSTFCGWRSPRRASIPPTSNSIARKCSRCCGAQTTSPGDIASRRWWETAFAGHPYGRPVNGTLESVPTITVDDLKAYTHRVLARENLKIAVVGDIDAETVKPMLDRVFGALPAKPDLATIESVIPQGLGRRIVVNLDVPQAVVDFGGAGIARKDPDFMAAYIVNHILGGGSFSSRLYHEVREKRGLAYSVSDSLVWLDHAALFLGGTATRADRAGETLDLIEKEIHRLAAGRPDRGGTRQGQGLSQQLVRAQSRHIEQDRVAPGAVAARRSRHRLFHAAAGDDRGGDARRRASAWPSACSTAASWSPWSASPRVLPRRATKLSLRIERTSPHGLAPSDDPEAGFPGFSLDARLTEPDVRRHDPRHRPDQYRRARDRRKLRARLGAGRPERQQAFDRGAASLRRAALAVAAGEVRARLERLAGSRLTRDGVLVIIAQRHRTQGRNRARRARPADRSHPPSGGRPVKRRPTRPTKASRERRIEGKKRRGGIKRLRQSKPSFE